MAQKRVPFKLKKILLFPLIYNRGKTMKEFDELLKTADQLLSPNGCPWDKEQTIFTLQPYLLEEVHELLEAIDSLDSKKIEEELGDVFYALVFLAKIAEADGRFTFKEAIDTITKKLIRRHPHVFGNTKVASSDEVIKKWDEIKKQEKSQQERKGIFDGIPPTLPAIAKAQKMANKIRKRRKISDENELFQNETELGVKFWALICEADSKGIDAEGALRRILAKIDAEERQIPLN